MPSVALVASKGGAGKSTIAVHLSVLAGPGALLVDLDPQGSAADWASVRTAEFPEIATGRPESLVRLLQRRSKAAWTIIDTAPHDLDAIEQVAPHVDLVLVPTRASRFDMRAISGTIGVLRRAEARSAIVLNAIQPQRGIGEAPMTDIARRALDAYGLPICPVVIRQRIALAQALNDGSAVSEFDPAGAAAVEITQLWRWIGAQAA